MFKRFKTFVTNKAQKLENAIAPMLVVGTAIGVFPTVYASNKATTAIKSIIEVIYKIFTYIGVILALWGIGSLVMAFKNEDADSKSRAIMCLVVGFCLVALKALFGGIIDSLLA